MTAPAPGLDPVEQAKIGELAEFFGYLRDRWRDEQQYEDFAEYRAALEKRLPDGATIERFTSRPFRLTFLWRGVRRMMKCEGNSIVWVRVSSVGAVRS